MGKIRTRDNWTTIYVGTCHAHFYQHFSDLLSDDCTLSMHIQFKEKHGDCITWLEFYSLISALPNEWEMLLNLNDYM